MVNLIGLTRKTIIQYVLRHFLLYMEKKIVLRLMNNLQQPQLAQLGFQTIHLTLLKNILLNLRE